MNSIKYKNLNFGYMKLKVLVCGGAGYIGSHMAKMLNRHGDEVVVFDNLSTGHEHAVKWGTLVQGDLLNKRDLESLFNNHEFDAVMHFSARSLVGESMVNPAIYYENNVVGTFNLLEQMRSVNVDKFIFSSSAAIFGNPVTEKIDEAHPKEPINPYGRTKLMVEQMLKDYFDAYGLKSVSLRYFNAAGADPEGELREEHDPETHLIPNILKSVINETSSKLKIFGDDYETPDGTCIRDYVHVNDLCEAHLSALQYLHNHEGNFAFNLGNGSGFSVMEVVNAASRIVGSPIDYCITERREGDPAVLVSDSSLAKQELGWEPQYPDIENIIASAWKAM